MPLQVLSIFEPKRVFLYHIMKQEEINMMRFTYCSGGTLVREKTVRSRVLTGLPGINPYGREAHEKRSPLRDIYPAGVMLRGRYEVLVHGSQAGNVDCVDASLVGLG